MNVCTMLSVKSTENLKKHMAGEGTLNIVVFIWLMFVIYFSG